MLECTVRKPPTASRISPFPPQPHALKIPGFIHRSQPGLRGLRPPPPRRPAGRRPPMFVFSRKSRSGPTAARDYLSIDATAHRLYVAHATQVVVIDTTTDAVVATIPDTPGVHGVAFAPALGRAFVSDGKGNKVSIVDLATLKPLGEVAVTGTKMSRRDPLTSPARRKCMRSTGAASRLRSSPPRRGRSRFTIPHRREAGIRPGRSRYARTGLQQLGGQESLVAAIDTKTHAVVARSPDRARRGPDRTRL